MLASAPQRAAVPLGSWTVQMIWPRLLQPTGRFRRRSLRLGCQAKPMFEQKTDALLPLPSFAKRMACSLLLAFCIVGVALTVGVVGYHRIAKLSWIDSLLNASMILTGMGPVAPMTTTAAKLFASAYALFSGLVFLSAVGLIFAPIFHRVLHKFHLDEADDEDDDKGKAA